MIVFTACSAKSGTYYFGRNLGHHPDCLVCCEPRKNQGNLMGTWLSRRREEDLIASDKIWEASHKEIAANCKMAPIYVESDFRFIGYSELALQDFIDKEIIKIVVLKREKAKIVRQIVRNHYYKGSYIGWLLVPGLEHNMIPLNSDDPLTRCIWYMFEVEARINRIKEIYHTIEFFEFDVDGEKLPQWETLASFLDIKLTDKMINILKKDAVINSWENRNDVIKIPEFNLANVRKKVEEFEKGL